MIFRQVEAVRKREKTATRRAIKNGERIRPDGKFDTVCHVSYKKDEAHSRQKWQIGKTYAAVPKMGHAAFGYIRITDIYAEHLGDITEEGAIEEGVESVEEYKKLWISINGDWDDDLPVWVIHFEYVGDAPSKVDSFEEQRQTLVKEIAQLRNEKNRLWREMQCLYINKSEVFPWNDDLQYEVLDGVDSQVVFPTELLHHWYHITKHEAFALLRDGKITPQRASYLLEMLVEDLPLALEEWLENIPF